ncbi:hypothetical protein COBT_002267 [Conglomerata obtusa]
MVSAINEQVYKSEEFVELISGRYNCNIPVFRRFLSETINTEIIALQETFSAIRSNEMIEDNLDAYQPDQPSSESDAQNEAVHIQNEVHTNENGDAIMQHEIQSAASVSLESSSSDSLSMDNNVAKICVISKNIVCENENTDTVNSTDDKKTEIKDNLLNKKVLEIKKDMVLLKDNLVYVPDNHLMFENNNTCKSEAHDVNDDKHLKQMITNEMNEKNESNDISDKEDIVEGEKELCDDKINTIDKDNVGVALEINDNFNEKINRSNKEDNQIIDDLKNDEKKTYLLDSRKASDVIDNNNVIEKKWKENERKKVEIKEDIKVEENAENDLNNSKEVTTMESVVRDGTKAQMKYMLKKPNNQIIYVHNVENSDKLEYISKNLNDLTKAETKLKNIVGAIVLDDEDDIKTINILCNKKNFKRKNILQSKKVEKIKKNDVLKNEKNIMVKNTVETIGDEETIKDKNANKNNLIKETIEAIKDVKNVKDINTACIAPITNTHLVVNENIIEEMHCSCFSGILHYLKSFF